MEYWTSSFLAICITRAIHVCKAVALNHWNSGTLSLTDPLTGFVVAWAREGLMEKQGEEQCFLTSISGASIADITDRCRMCVPGHASFFSFSNRDCEITTYVTMKQSQQKGKLGIQDWQLGIFLVFFSLSSSFLACGSSYYISLDSWSVPRQRRTGWSVLSIVFCLLSMSPDSQV